MKVITKAVFEWDGEKYVVVEQESHDYDGPVALLKENRQAKESGARVKAMDAKAAAEVADRNAIVKPQSQAFLNKYILGSEGFDPQLMSAMDSATVDQVGRAYDNGSQAIKTALLRKGIDSSQLPAGGDFVRNISAFEGARASDMANSLRQNKLANLQQALTNRFQAAQVNNQSAGLFNPAVFQASANQAFGDRMSALQQGTFLGKLGGTLAGIGVKAGTAALGIR